MTSSCSAATIAKTPRLTTPIWCGPIWTCSPRQPDGAASRITCCTRGRGLWTGSWWRNCARRGLPLSAACARGCRPSTGWRVSLAGQSHDRGRCAVTEPVVLYEIDNKVGTITLNRPDKLNAISAELQHALLDAFRKADA